MAPKKHKPRAERVAEMQQAARERIAREKKRRIWWTTDLRGLRLKVERLQRKVDLIFASHQSRPEEPQYGDRQIVAPQKPRPPRALTKEELDRKWCEENGVRYEDTEAAKQGSPIQIRKLNLLEVKNSSNKKV